jgi:hypothetical protein
MTLVIFPEIIKGRLNIRTNRQTQTFMNRYGTAKKSADWLVKHTKNGLDRSIPFLFIVRIKLFEVVA